MSEYIYKKRKKNMESNCEYCKKAIEKPEGFSFIKIFAKMNTVNDA